MFFNKHLKQGKEIGKVALGIIKPTFLGTDYFIGDNLFPPIKLFEDRYVVGFFTSYVTTIINFVLGGKNWSAKKKGECIIEALEVIDPSQTLINNHLNLSKSNSYIQELRADKEFMRGGNDAETLVGVAYNYLKPDDPDPILTKAKSLAPSFEKELAFMEIGTPGSNTSLVSAVIFLTINSHIKKII